MSSNQNEVRFNKSLVLSIGAGLVPIFLLAVVPVIVPVIVPGISWSGWPTKITDVRYSLLVLPLASMTLAANLLTSTPTENLPRQVAFYVIAIAGGAVALSAIQIESYGALTFVVLGVLPAGIAYGRIFAAIFCNHLWLLLPSVVGAALILVAMVLNVPEEPMLSPCAITLMATLGTLLLALTSLILCRAVKRDPSQP